MGNKSFATALFAFTLFGGCVLSAQDTPAGQAGKVTDDQIKATLPQMLGSLKLQPDKTEITPDMGMGFHGVTGKYAGDGAQPIHGTVGILDYGPDAPKSAMNMAEMAAGLTLPPQSTSEIQRQRITVAGSPAVEEVSGKGTVCVAKLVVGKRFFVEIDASPTDEAAFRKMLDGVDLKQIEALGR